MIVTTNEFAALLGFTPATLLRKRFDPSFPKPLEICKKPLKWRKIDVIEYLGSV